VRLGFCCFCIDFHQDVCLHILEFLMMYVCILWLVFCKCLNNHSSGVIANCWCRDSIRKKYKIQLPPSQNKLSVSSLINSSYIWYAALILRFQVSRNIFTAIPFCRNFVIVLFFFNQVASTGKQFSTIIAY
jgi:hypothetical protein